MVGQDGRNGSNEVASYDGCTMFNKLKRIVIMIKDKSARIVIPHYIPFNKAFNQCGYLVNTV